MNEHTHTPVQGTANYGPQPIFVWHSNVFYIFKGLFFKNKEKKNMQQRPHVPCKAKNI